MHSDTWGTTWRVDLVVRRLGRSAVVRSLWIVKVNEDVPRFVTCWVNS